MRNEWVDFRGGGVKFDVRKSKKSEVFYGRNYG